MLGCCSPVVCPVAAPSGTASFAVTSVPAGSDCWPTAPATVLADSPPATPGSPAAASSPRSPPACCPLSLRRAVSSCARLSACLLPSTLPISSRHGIGGLAGGVELRQRLEAELLRTGRALSLQYRQWTCRFIHNVTPLYGRGAPCLHENIVFGGCFLSFYAVSGMWAEWVI